MKAQSNGAYKQSRNMLTLLRNPNVLAALITAIGLLGSSFIALLTKLVPYVMKSFATAPVPLPATESNKPDPPGHAAGMKVSQLGVSSDRLRRAGRWSLREIPFAALNFLLIRYLVGQWESGTTASKSDVITISIAMTFLLLSIGLKFAIDRNRNDVEVLNSYYRAIEVLRTDVRTAIGIGRNAQSQARTLEDKLRQLSSQKVNLRGPFQ